MDAGAQTTQPAPPARAARGVLLLGAVVLVQLLLLAGLLEQWRAHPGTALEPPQVTTVQSGDLLPEFTVQLADGQTLTRDALLARAPMLVFVASAGCAACEERRAELVQSLQREAPALGLTVLVLGDGSRAWVTEFCRDTNWLPGVDPGGRAGRLFTNGLVPFFALVDRAGAIRAASFAGFDHDIRHALEDSLASDTLPHDTPRAPHSTQEGG